MASVKNLHFLLVPFMAQGHLIPMVDMAKMLARRGVTVTFVTTLLNKLRINSTLNRAVVDSGLPIRLLQLRFPSVEAGLPEGCESADAVPSADLQRNFFAAIHMLQKQLEDWLGKQSSLPSCILADKHIIWLAETCRKFGIPRIVFDGMSCFTLLCTHNIYTSKAHEAVPKFEPFVVPGLPNDDIYFTRAQLPGLLNPGLANLRDIREQVLATEEEAYGVVVNSFDELENGFVDGCKAIKGGKLWCIGPLSLTDKDELDKARRGDKASIDENECLMWLDVHNPRSVVYACLGSLSRLTCEQMIELCLGLDSSNHPFVLVIKGDKHNEDIEDWIAKNGFEERIKGRGLLIRGWAPQVLILSHHAVGAFLTHCGWNSTLEGVCAGVPMVTWPMFAEQFFNEKLVVEVLRIGVSVGAKAVVHLGEEEMCGVSIKRDAIREAVEKLMEEGGEKKRIRARELGEMAKRSIEEGGSSHLNLTMLIQNILEQVSDIK